MRKIKVKREVMQGKACPNVAYHLYVEGKKTVTIHILPYHYEGFTGGRYFVVYNWNTCKKKVLQTVLDIYREARLSIEEMDATYAPYDDENNKALSSAWPEEWFKEL